MKSKNQPENNKSLVPPLPIDTLISEERIERFKSVLAKRSNRLTVVVENCHDPHNATAIVRTCDAFGLDEVHIINDKHSFKINNSVSKGTHNYVEIFVHKSIEEAYVALRESGFKIFASDLAEGKTLHTLDLVNKSKEDKIALVFGEESLGLTEKASKLADGHFLIPMSGFTQSLNVSVAVAVSVYAVRQSQLCSQSVGDLDQETQIKRYTKWVKRKRGIAVDRLIQDYKGQPMQIEVIKHNIQDE